MSAISVKYLHWPAILLGMALSACHNEDASPGSAPAAPVTPVTPATYSVSATVSGLNGSGLVLQNNGGGDITVAANGSVTFAAMQASGTAYAVTVETQPSSPAQTCTVAGGSGTIGESNVTNVTVTCADNFVPTYTPAPKGDPQGTATTQMIDAVGGSVTSADGRITLTIPAGALGTATTVSIQPITNTTPNGIGSGYRLQPEGTTFGMPVNLTFHLSPTEALALSSTFVTTQHADGMWYSQPNQQRDSSAQTVSVSTTHFSDWAIAETLKIDPTQTRVKTSASAQFRATILIIEDHDVANPGGDELAMPVQVDLNDYSFMFQSVQWAVNNIVGGNAQYGVIGNYVSPGQFFAPDQVPTPNPVTITVTVQVGRSKVIAPALADIYFQEFWTGTTNITQLDGTKIQANVTFVSKPDPSQSETLLHFVVQSGVVNVTTPPTNGNGCAQSISPDHYAIGAADATSFEGGDGSMMLTYSTAPGVDQADITGGGTTAWPAILTTVCENGTLVLNTTEAAPWWPVNPGQTLTATNGGLDGTVSNALASGTIHLTRR
jgi:hypothetical protein